MGYADDVKIDVNALDIEWLNQSDLVVEYIQKVHKARIEKNNIWEELKTVRSELIREANDDPEGCCDKAKPNAADIEAFYRTHEDYKEAKREFIEAEDKYETLKAMQATIAYTRTDALKNLVSLHQQQYFAGPKVPRNLPHEMDKFESRKKETKKQKKIAAKKIGKGMKRKKSND